MNLGKKTSILLTILFVIDLVILMSVMLPFLGVNLELAGNPILRIIFLFVIFVLARAFYNFIKTTEDNESDDGENIQSDSSGSDLNKKIAVGLVLSVFIIFIMVFAIGNLFLNGESSNIGSTSNFNNSLISFSYPSDWEKGNDSNYTFMAQSSSVTLAVLNEGIDDATLDDVIKELKDGDIKYSSYEILSSNKTTVDGVEAYAFSINYPLDNLYSRNLIFVHGNECFTFKFEARNLDDITDVFILVKNSIQLK